MTPQISAALAHVRKHHPEVTTVVYFLDNQWGFFDADNKRPAFDEDIDVSILEAASDSVTHLPCVFSIYDEVST